MTFHAGRMHITNPNLSNDDEFEGLIEQLDATISDAVERVLGRPIQKSSWASASTSAALRRTTSVLSPLSAYIPSYTTLSSCGRSTRWSPRP